MFSWQDPLAPWVHGGDTRGRRPGVRGRAARWLVLALLAPALTLGGPAAARPRPAVAATSRPPSQPAPAAWQALPHGGLKGIVQALAAVGTDLYVGGLFTETADGQVQNLNNIALLSNGQWQVLPDHGLNGGVTALAVIGSDVYAGGVFTATADGSLNNLGYVARLSGGAAGAWHPLASQGLNSDVRALAARNSDLYVGGFFDQSGDGTVKDLNAVARYSSGAWVPLPDKGLFNFFVLHCCSVDAFAFNGDNLVAGGIFTSTDDFAVQNLGGLAQLSGGTTWSATPNQGLGLDQPFAHPPHALAYLGSDLYAAGTFTRTTDHAISNLNWIAKLSNGAWSPVPHNGLNTNHNSGAALALAPRGNDLYVGGTFTQTADGQVSDLNGIAVLSGGAAWSALPDGGIRSGFDFGVQAIAFAGDDLYVGGLFTETADGAVQNLGSLAVLAVPPLPNYRVYLPLVRR